MAIVFQRPCVVVEDAPVGWAVYLDIDEDRATHHANFECRRCARAYAKGLSRGSSYPTEDRSTHLPGWETDARSAQVIDRGPARDWKGEEVAF
ncbi:hypothetical protein [Sphingomonas sp. T9W2]|uniref:hypothetical protein n=1 Tax=Sphingomonas sp. T9W2 TaxID=3143183 RepID=UPI0031F4D4E7